MLKRTDDAFQANQETGFLIQTFDPEVPGYVFWPIIFGGLPPEKWSSLMYGLWPDGGLKNGKEATHCGRDRHEAAAG